MKRYEPIEVHDYNGSHADMDESPTGEYVRYSDLIAAGCLVPVPVGEECEYGDWLEQQNSTAFLLDGDVNVHVIINRYQSANGGQSAPIDGNTIVQPVRLVPLAELEGES